MRLHLPERGRPSTGARPRASRKGKARRPQSYARRRHESDVEFLGTDEEFDQLLKGG